MKKSFGFDIKHNKYGILVQRFNHTESGKESAIRLFKRWVETPETFSPDCVLVSNSVSAYDQNDKAIESVYATRTPATNFDYMAH